MNEKKEKIDRIKKFNLRRIETWKPLKPSEDKKERDDLVQFSGRIIANPRCGRPVSRAEVEIGGRKTYTDGRGMFNLVIPTKRDPKHRKRFVMNIRKEGFGLVSKVFTSGAQNQTHNLTRGTVQVFDPTKDTMLVDLRTLILQNSCTGSLSSRVDWSRYENLRIPYAVDNNGLYSGEATAEAKAAAEYAEFAKTCNAGISLSLRANSLVDSSGNPPSGNLTATISSVDIYDPSSMPGDFTVQSEDGMGYMITYGAGTISISSGSKMYNLKKGENAKLSIPINQAQLKYINKTHIPLLVYDEKKGIWKLIGKASLNKERTAYEGEINHLSAFNMDLVKTDQSCVKIDSSGITTDYDLEIIIPFGGGYPIIRTVYVDNTPEKTHVIYNLPSNTNIVLRAFEPGTEPPVPITSSVSVNTGGPQNPSTPNNPDYPYGACNGQVSLSSCPVVPALSGWANSDRTITLSWRYCFPPGLQSTSDGYEIQESTTSATAGFSQIERTMNDHRENVVYTTGVKPAGNYWYKVRAYLPGGSTTSYSNIVHMEVIVEVGNGVPTVLRINNNLPSDSDGWGDWSQYNKIITVCIAGTSDEVYNLYGERLGPTTFDGQSMASTSDVSQLDELDPGSSQDFDVSMFGGDYWVLIYCGWWEYFFDSGSGSWVRHYSSIVDCDGMVYNANKWVLLQITSHGDPTIINVLDELPPKNYWGDSRFCTP